MGKSVWTLYDSRSERYYKIFSNAAVLRNKEEKYRCFKNKPSRWLVKWIISMTPLLKKQIDTSVAHIIFKIARAFVHKILRLVYRLDLTWRENSQKEHNRRSPQLQAACNYNTVRLNLCFQEVASGCESISTQGSPTCMSSPRLIRCTGNCKYALHNLYGKDS